MTGLLYKMINYPGPGTSTTIYASDYTSDSTSSCESSIAGDSYQCIKVKSINEYTTAWTNIEECAKYRGFYIGGDKFWEYNNTIPKNIIIRRKTSYYNEDENATTATDWPGPCDYEWATSANQPQIKPHRREVFREIVRTRYTPAIHVKRKPIVHPGELREQRARETLRMIVGDEQFIRFLKKGFITVTNPQSGYTYQIFHAKHHFTHVYKDGKCVERLCVYLAGDFPPTDFVITLYLMVLNNEDRVWKIANKHGALPGTWGNARLEEELGLDKLVAEFKEKGLSPLTEIFAKLKKVA